jgi:transposase-like protein
MKPFQSLIQFHQHFDTEEKCRFFLEQQMWNGTPTCPHCGSTNVCRFANGKMFKCRVKDCRKKFTVTVGTVMESSKIPLTKWFLAIYVVFNHSKGISSVQLSNYIDCCQKTSWFLLHRIREMSIDRAPAQLSNVVEADETLYGGKNRFRHAHKKVKHSQGRSQEDKTPVFGLVERGGKLRTQVVKDTKAKTLKPIIKEMVAEGSILCTDEYRAYRGLNKDYAHDVVNHRSGEYVNGQTHTNTIEGYWSIFKRCIYGIYHSVSEKHLQNYCNEVTYRYNERQLTQDVRFAKAVSNSGGRLTWNTLVHG